MRSAYMPREDDGYTVFRVPSGYLVERVQDGVTVSGIGRTLEGAIERCENEGS